MNYFPNGMVPEPNAQILFLLAVQYLGFVCLVVFSIIKVTVLENLKINSENNGANC